MANWGIALTDFLEGGMRGFTQGQEDANRMLRTRALRREEKKAEAWDKEMEAAKPLLGVQPDAKPAESRSWFGRMGDAISDAYSRIVGGAPSAVPQGSVTGSSTSTMADRRGPTAVPAGGDRQFAINPDQTEVGEGVSRSAFGYQSGGSSEPSPAGGTAPGASVQGSSGAVPPPGTGAPSAEAQAIAAAAVRRNGGTPSAVPAPPATYGASQNVPGAGIGPQVGGSSGAVAPYGRTDPLTQSAPAGETWPGQTMVGQTGRTPQPMVGAEPPGGAPQGPAQPVDPASAYPRDVGAPARSVGGQVTLSTADVRQGAPVIQLGQKPPKGAIPTPEDQRRDAEAIRIANQPLPEGSRPQDAVRVITGDKDGKTLPTSTDMQKFYDTVIPRLMAIDPERALRLQVQLGDAMRQGAMMGITRAQVALEAGNPQIAQQNLMRAYNMFMPTGDKAQFTISKDGKSLMMTRFDEKTGKQLDGKPVPVTREMLAGMGAMLASPQVYAQYLLSRDQFDETKRSNRAREGLQASAQAAADRRFTLQFNESKRQFDLQFGETQRRNDLAEKRQGALEARQGVLDASLLAERAAKTRKSMTEEQIIDNRRNGFGYHLSDRPDAWMRDYANRVDDALAQAPLPKDQADKRQAITSTATALGMFNSQLSAVDAVKIATAWATGRSTITIPDDAKTGDGYTIADLGNNRRIAVPDTLLGDRAGPTITSIPPQIPGRGGAPNAGPGYDPTRTGPPITPGSPRIAGSPSTGQLPSAVPAGDEKNQEAIARSLRDKKRQETIGEIQQGARRATSALEAPPLPSAPGGDVSAAVQQAAAGIRRAGNPPGAVADAARNLATRLRISVPEAQRMLQEALK